jgi:arylsulfatase A-like enzyme
VPDDVRNPDPLYAYINTIEHIDSEVGRLLDRLDDLNLADNTYVLYTTDNGPWLRFKHHGGTAGPLRDGKGTTFEGGQRVPCVLRGPGVPAGSVCHELTGTIDVLPTLAALIGGALPSEHRIDGVDMSALWHGKKEAVSREEFLYYSSHGVLEGIRQGPWKLLVKLPRQNRNTRKPKAAEVLLFNLEEDLGEKENLADKYPEVVSKLHTKMDALDAEITSNARLPWFEDDEITK